MSVSRQYLFPDYGVSYTGGIRLPHQFLLHHLSVFNTIDYINVTSGSYFVGRIAPKPFYRGTLKLYTKLYEAVNESDVHIREPVLIDYKLMTIFYENQTYKATTKQPSLILTLPTGIGLRFDPTRSLFFSGYNENSHSLPVYLLIYATDRQGVKTSSYEVNCKYYNETMKNWTSNQHCKVSEIRAYENRHYMVLCDEWYTKNISLRVEYRRHISSKEKLLNECEFF